MNAALVIIPTYNERENLGPITSAVLKGEPRVDVLVVDDNSPDGTGALADELGPDLSGADALVMSAAVADSSCEACT